MTTQTGTGTKRHVAKRFSGCGVDHLVYIDSHRFINYFKFIDQGDVDTPKNVFQKLGSFCGFAGRNPMNFVQCLTVQSFCEIPTFGGKTYPTTLGIVFTLASLHVGGLLVPANRPNESQLRPSPLCLLLNRTELILRGSWVGSRLQDNEHTFW